MIYEAQNIACKKGPGQFVQRTLRFIDDDGKHRRYLCTTKRDDEMEIDSDYVG